MKNKKGAVAFRCRKRFLRPDGVYGYSEWAKKRLEKHIKSQFYKNIMALRFIKCLIHRKAIVFYYSVFRSPLNATAPILYVPDTTIIMMISRANAAAKTEPMSSADLSVPKIYEAFSLFVR